jgi:hypothetical protein
MSRISRRDFLGSAGLGVPASILATPPQSDRTEHRVQQMKVIRIEATLLERPLTDRFWMSIFPIGGMKPVARRLILKVHTGCRSRGIRRGYWWRGWVVPAGSGRSRHRRRSFHGRKSIGKVVCHHLQSRTGDAWLVKNRPHCGNGRDRRRTLRRHVQICWSAALQVS